MKEYRIAKGWAIFIYLTVPLLIALFCWLLLTPFFSGKGNNLKIFWFIAPVSLAMIVLMVVGLLNTFKGKFVIDDDKIFTVSTFSKRQLMFHEIQGYRVNDKYILIEPGVDGKKKIKISKYFGNTNEIIEWLSSRYFDLDRLNTEQEKKEILCNEDFGWSVEQRELKLKAARKTANIFNWAGVLAGAWTLLRPVPYEYAVISSISIPIISIFVFKIFRGLIRIDGKKASAYPTISGALFCPAMGLCLRALFDFNIFDYAKVWTPSIFVAIIFISILLAGHKEFKFKTPEDFIVVLALSLILFGYGYGSVITINCLYDKTTTQIFNAKVISKRISSGTTTTYYFELTPWGQQKMKDEVSVSKTLYKRLEANDAVKIYFRNGKFEIPWFTVADQ